MIALTFDDGPSANMEYILDILERHGAFATFFILGEQAENRQDSILRAVRNGNEVAGHTWSHLLLTQLSDQEIQNSILSTSEVIEKITGKPRLMFFRPPYGHVDRRVSNASAEIGFSMVNWNIDTQDWLLLDSDLIYDVVINDVKEGNIILLHEILTPTVRAMESLIPALINEGYRLVTISELLFNLYGELIPGKVYGSPGF